MELHFMFRPDIAHDVEDFLIEVKCFDGEFLDAQKLEQFADGFAGAVGLLLVCFDGMADLVEVGIMEAAPL